MEDDDTEQEARERHFVEEFALLLEESGLPRMHGRVLGHLLICDPPHQSSAELAEALNASRGSISQSTRALIALDLVQRHPVQGTRASYFIIHPDALTRHLHADMARMKIGRELLEKGIDLLEGAPEERLERLVGFHALYAFMEREFPKLIARFEAQQAEENS